MKSIIFGLFWADLGAQSAGTILENNICFNGPRAGNDKANPIAIVLVINGQESFFRDNFTLSVYFQTKLPKRKRLLAIGRLQFQ